MTLHQDQGPVVRAGIGLRAPHHAAILAARPPVGLLEIHAENYFGGGPPLRSLDALRRDYPISVHAVGLSLGGAEGVNVRHLARLAALVERVDPVLVSDHLSWIGVGGTYLNDLLPLPYTEEALTLVAANVAQVQDALRRPVLIENPAAYLRFVESAMSEPQFLAELARRTGCGILCDVNNLYVNCRNHGGDPIDWLDGLPSGAVGEIHLAGHCVNEVDGGAILIDDHGSAVSDAVWRLHAEAARRFPRAASVIEWDTNLPSLDVLVAEAAAADQVARLARAAERAVERHAA